MTWNIFGIIIISFVSGILLTQLIKKYRKIITDIKVILTIIYISVIIFFIGVVLYAYFPIRITNSNHYVVKYINQTYPEYRLIRLQHSHKFYSFTLAKDNYLTDISLKCDDKLQKCYKNEL